MELAGEWEKVCRFERMFEAQALTLGRQTRVLVCVPRLPTRAVNWGWRSRLLAGWETMENANARVPGCLLSRAKPNVGTFITCLSLHLQIIKGKQFKITEM